MKCVLCGGETLKKKAEEEVRLNGDHILVEVEVEVCLNCREKYYGAEVMDELIKIKESLGKDKSHLHEIGSVYKFA